MSDHRKKALLATMGVGTIDQALLAALQARHQALRLFGLHRSVLIVDEVHACDAYMLTVLAALLRLHSAMGGSAVLLSATLSLEQRRLLCAAFWEGLQATAATPSSEDYPLLTVIGRQATRELPVAPRRGSPRGLPISFHRSNEDVCGRLRSALAEGLCACWIRNSVADAMEAYDALLSELGPERVTLFHARFALGDRLKIEQEIVNRFGPASDREQRAGRLVIATQVVEQSLDLDFDVLVTDLRPVDLVIQRAGRLQRHRRSQTRPPPLLEVFAPPWSASPPVGWLSGPFTRTGFVYGNPALLWRTAGELERRGELVVPRDSRALIESVYGPGAQGAPEALEGKSSLAEGAELAHASVAQMAIVRPETGYLRNGADWSDDARALTRLGEPTTTLRLFRDEGGTASPWRADLGNKLQWSLSQLSVRRAQASQEFPHDAEALKEAKNAMPFVDEDSVGLLLRRQGDSWTGRLGMERRGEMVPRAVSYSTQRGLEFLKEA